MGLRGAASREREVKSDHGFLQGYCNSTSAEDWHGRNTPVLDGYVGGTERHSQLRLTRASGQSNALALPDFVGRLLHYGSDLRIYESIGVWCRADMNQ